jgi:hypothetical protein
MNKFCLSFGMFCLFAHESIAGATAGAPAPLVGAIGGPFGVLAVAAGYAGYRLYKAKSTPR